MYEVWPSEQSCVFDHMICFAGTHSQNIQVYAKENMQHLHTLSSHIGKVTVLCVVDSQAEYMFSGSSDAAVTVSHGNITSAAIQLCSPPLPCKTWKTFSLSHENH